MSPIFSALFYTLIFLAVYVQVFFLITFFENRKKIVKREGSTKLAEYPGVTIIVPCWNEETTIGGTVHSLLNLNYPQDKLQIFLIDDGSTDNTWQVISKFAEHKNIQVFQKENGGKHTALNYCLAKVETPFLGCLDADSFADKESLARIMSYFQKNADVMAVAPSIIVSNAKTIVQKAQNAEYNMAVYVKKMLGFLGAIHVTPGPLTIFRKRVFDDLGPYRKAHNTEDMEIAYRMQQNFYKIDQCNDAYVYTNTPNTVKKLYKQRLRWIYGFINNTFDYRKILFRKKYGNFSVFTVPAGIISVLAASYLFVRLLYFIGDNIYSKIVQLSLVGFSFDLSGFTFDPFFINTQISMFVAVILYSMVIFAVVLGGRISGHKGSALNIAYFFIIFSIVAPFWLMKAVYNTVISKKPAWR